MPFSDDNPSRLSDADINPNDSINEISSDENGLIPEKHKLRIPQKDSSQITDIEKINAINIKEEELWNEIGLHRTLGGFFRGFVFMLLAAIITVVSFTFIIQVLMPYPTSQGYYNIAQGLFSLIYALFDIGTSYSIQIFISEYMVKDKRQMIKYIQFYVWYGLIMSSVKVTILSWWVFATVNTQINIAHLAWILLILNAKNFPGIAGIFIESLRGMQRFDHTAVLDFLKTNGFSLICQIIFFIGGRYFGAMHPIIGELLGLSMGMVLANYANDLLTMLVSIGYFAKVIKRFGFSMRDFWGHNFDWSIIKRCLLLGLGVSWAPIVGSAISLIRLNMAIILIPGYATWSVLASFGSTLAGAINLGNLDVTAAISESINNGKMELSKYYVAQSFKYWGFLFFAMSGVVVTVLPIITHVLFLVPSVADQYQGAIIFILPGIISMLFDVPNAQFRRILITAKKIMLTSTLDVICSLIGLVIWVLFLYVWQVWNWGTIGIILLFVLIDIPSKLLTFIVYLIYIQTRVMKINLGWWQTVGAGIITFGAVVVVGILFVNLAFVPLIEHSVAWFGPEIGIIFSGIIGLLVVLLGFMLFLFPFVYGVAGGWDSAGLEMLRKAYLLSGPSKPFIKILYQLSVVGSKLSPWYNKFPIAFEQAFVEAKELIILKTIDQNSLDDEIRKTGHITM